MLKHILTASYAALLLVSCAGPAPVPASPTPIPSPTAVPHADALRFALLGQPDDVNAWSLYDDSGASYANYALHSDESPRLYRLSTPAREFEPYVADSLPSAVSQEGAYYVATIRLKSGLTWSDGSALSAEDVAFTVNTALAFHLGYDWLSAYDPSLLDRAEAVDAGTVRFYFTRPFNVGNWQYGALQGPVLSRAYWSPKLTEAAALLPSADLIADLEKARDEANEMQGRVDADNAQLLTTLPNTSTYTELSTRVVRNQNELNSLNTKVQKLQDEYDAALGAAHAALFALDDAGEPVFGPFLRAEQSGEAFTRVVNPAYPFGKPNYDRAIYRVFGDDSSALAALNRGEVDVILDSLQVPEDETEAAARVLTSPSSSAAFIAINPAVASFQDPALRQALYCLSNLAFEPDAALRTLVLPGNEYWLTQNLSDPCRAPGSARMQAANILKAAGYTWKKEPTESDAGEGLISPDGNRFPSVTLLAPLESEDADRAKAAKHFEQVAQEAGISLAVRSMSGEDLRYAVYSSHNYELALLQWRLSTYPGYLCEWFQPPSPFAYGSDRLTSACGRLNATADLETARQAAVEVQSILMEDLPFLPLYQTQRYEIHRNVTYPFERVLDGLFGLYGAPDLAIPAQ